MSQHLAFSLNTFPLHLALALNILPFNLLKAQSCVSVVRAENGPEFCLKWGTVFYKKHVHLLKYFRGKRLIVPLRCIRSFSLLKLCNMPFFSKVIKSTELKTRLLCKYVVYLEITLKDVYKKKRHGCNHTYTAYGEGFQEFTEELVPNTLIR